jgi:hypothetical protein
LTHLRRVTPNNLAEHQLIGFCAGAAPLVAGVVPGVTGVGTTGGGAVIGVTMTPVTSPFTAFF